MSDDGSKLLESLMGALGDNPSEKIGQMLSSLTASQDAAEPEEQQQTENTDGGIDFEMIMKLQGLMGKLSGGENDERSALLCALKPFLSEEKRPQVDQAIKLLKLSSLAKTAQEMDLFKNLL